MATKTATTERDARGRGLKPRSMPFLGLVLMPPGALIAGLAAHAAVADNVAALALTAAGITALTCVAAIAAHLIGRHREPVIRWMVVATVVAIGVGEAVTVAVGLLRWWTTTFLFVGYGGLVVPWALTRIDSFRRDQKGDTEPAEDTLTKKLGVENTRFGKPVHHFDADGDLARIEVPVQNGPGETVEVIQSAVPGIESVADQALGGGVPRGRSRAVPGEGAGTATLVIITKDVLKGLIEYPGPSSPGGCVTEPLVSGVYEDQQLVLTYIAGGHEVAPNPSSKGRMGMTRTGKTLNAQIDALEKISRRNVQIMWFDTIKGAQTVRPMRRGLDIIVADDDPKAFRAGMKAAQKLIEWRANRLGDCGYRAWTPECATDPRLMMPLLVLHFEEADALCEIAPEEMVFLASKGLSAGVVTSYSLQRADNQAMPTGLRFNIGNWSCFGCGDSYSSGFALSPQTIDAGAHPENWKQSKPGYFYTEGIGIDEQRWPVPAKSYFATDALMEAHCEIWGPRMMPLDRGSAEAMGDWYTTAKQSTLAKVAEWDAGPDAAPVVHDGTSDSAVSRPNTTLTTASDSGDEADEGYAEMMRQVQTEIDEIGDELERDGTYAEVQADPEARRIDPGVPAAPVPPGAEERWGPSKAEAPSREAAIEALAAALIEMTDVAPTGADEDEDDEWVRREPDGAVLFSVGAVVGRYPFRSRPWFSGVLKDMAAGSIPLPGLTLEALDKPGEYRLRRVVVSAGAGHGA